MGFHPRKGTETCLEVPTEDATKFATRMSKVREEAGAAMRAAQETMKRFYNAKRQADPDYKPGDKVYLSGAKLVTHHPTKKFEGRRYGPFMVIRKVGAISYKLIVPDSWKVHPVFNTVFLRPWVPPIDWCSVLWYKTCGCVLGIATGFVPHNRATINCTKYNGLNTSGPCHS
jgi:hypothetical protein